MRLSGPRSFHPVAPAAPRPAGAACALLAALALPAAGPSDAAEPPEIPSPVRIEPDHAGPGYPGTEGAVGGRLHALVFGSGFRPATEFRLSPSGGDPSRSIRGAATVVDAGLAEVLFDLRGAEVGPWDLLAADGRGTGRIERAFTVRSWIGPRLRVALRGTEFYRRRDEGVLSLEFANVGSEEIPAPLFKVRATGGPSIVRFRLAGRAPVAGELIVLGRPRAGVPDRLAPGASGRVTIVYQAAVPCGAGETCPLTFEVRLFAPGPSDYIEWQRLENVDPESIPDGAWRETLPALSLAFGRTWREYRDLLGERIRRLSRRGAEPSALDAFRHAFAEARGNPGAAAVGRVRLAGGGPASGIQIGASGEAGPLSHAVSDEVGRFVLEGLPAGRGVTIVAGGHAILVDLGGSAEVAEGAARISVPPDSRSREGLGDVLGLDLVLEPSPGVPPPGLPPPVEDFLPASPLIPPDRLFTTVGTWRTKTIGARDPNEKTGGVGPGIDLSGSDAGADAPTPAATVDWTIRFENSRCAAASAEKVQVSDHLDPAIWDLSTLRLGAVSIGGDDPSKTISLGETIDGTSGVAVLPDVLVEAVPPDRELPPECAETELPPCEEAVEAEGDGDDPPRASIGDVRISVELRPSATRPGLEELVWEIESCRQPTACLGPGFPVGFLPPNDCATGRGDGWVAFSVSARAGAPSEIENEAVIAFDDDTRGEITVVGTVSLDPGELLAPENPVPADGRGLDGSSPVDIEEVLSWSPVLGADEYRISVWELDLAGNRSRAVVDEVTVPESFLSPSIGFPWTAGTAHEWQVVAVGPGGEAAGPAWRFATAPRSLPPPAVTPVVPPDGAEVAGPSAVLSWLAEPRLEVGSFSVYLSVDGGDPELVAHVGSATEYEPPGLSGGTSYRWQVVASGPGGETPGPIWSFSVRAAGFSRGDSNADGRTDLSDPIALLAYLFLGGAPPPCLAAGDHDDGGTLEITDAIAALGHLFLGGPPPAEPWERCDVDPTPDELSCAEFAPCE